MNEQIEDLKIKLIIKFYDGISEGIAMYAHWKDGVQYVGTTGKTLKQAHADIATERERAIKRENNES